RAPPHVGLEPADVHPKPLGESLPNLRALTMDTLQLIAAKDGRYDLQAFQFLYEALEVAAQATGRQSAEGVARHVSGKDLLEGIRRYGRWLCGPFAARVSRSGGVRETRDWGKIVFLLVENNLLNRQEEDPLDDFRDGYEFDAAF